MTTICLEALVLLRGKIVHEDPKKSDELNISKGRTKKNALEVVFGLALPRELSRVVVVCHCGKQLVFDFGFLFHCADRPLYSWDSGSCGGAWSRGRGVCDGGDGCWNGRDGGGCRYWLCPLYRSGRGGAGGSTWSSSGRGCDIRGCGKWGVSCASAGFTTAFSRGSSSATAASSRSCRSGRIGGNERAVGHGWEWRVWEGSVDGLPNLEKWTFTRTTVARWLAVYIAFRLRLVHSRLLSQTTRLRLTALRQRSLTTMMAPNTQQIRVPVPRHAEEVCQQMLLLVRTLSLVNGKIAVPLSTT